jgi:hypothetical protein
MTRKLLFALIGGIIIFIWQFLSFGMPNFHKAASGYTSSQDEILGYFEELGLEEGMYLLGQPDPSLSKDEQKAAMEEMEGKPWAVLNYHVDYPTDMVMPMIRGIIVCFIIAFILFWLFLQQKNPTLQNRIFLALAVGFIGFLFLPYSNFIWYKEPDIWAYFADGIVPWLIVGIIGHFMAGTGEKAPAAR